MLQSSAPAVCVQMMRTRPLVVAAPLPHGFAFHTYAPGMEDDWCRIQCSVQRFADEATARQAFQQAFAPPPGQLHRCILFVCDSAARPVGTAALWPEKDGTAARVDWVALIPGLQGRGIGKALIAKLLDIDAHQPVPHKVYFTAPAHCYCAIHICRGLGFVPRPADNVPCPEQQAAWECIQNILHRYDDVKALALGPGTHPKEEAHPLAPTMLFEHKSMFGKCSICKIFEIAAPTQSGDVPHAHDYAQIWYVSRGCCEHEMEGTQYLMTVGDVFLLPPKVSHCTRLKSDCRILCCEFYTECLFPAAARSYHPLDEITQEITYSLLLRHELFSANPKFTLSLHSQRTVENLLRTMMDEYTCEAPFYQDRLYLQILELLLVFAREYTRVTAPQSADQSCDKYRGVVELAIQYINTHYAEPISLEEICKISMVSKTYFCYLFKTITHQTFVEYLTNLRVARAMELLRQTARSVTDIAQTVGFHDSTHFSRTFKQLKGISPREYRRAARNE